MKRLNGMTGLLTGAAGAIGSETARHCLREGARVVLVDRDANKLGTLKRELLGELVLAEEQVLCLEADVTSDERMHALAGEVARSVGSLDFLFANAGVEGPVQDLREYPTEGFQQVLNVNVTGVFLTLKYFEPDLVEGGSILITSSVVGLKGSPRSAAYVASKHAVVGLMRTAAKGLAARRIRVNTVHPGLVESDMLRRIESGLQGLGMDDPRKSFMNATPMGTTTRSTVRPSSCASSSAKIVVYPSTTRRGTSS